MSPANSASDGLEEISRELMEVHWFGHQVRRAPLTPRSSVIDSLLVFVGALFGVALFFVVRT